MWSEGGFVGAFWKLFYLLDLLDGQWWSNGCERGLVGLWAECLGLRGEESNLPRVYLHLEVGVQCSPPWCSGHLWQWVMVVGLHCLCQLLLDVPQVLVVHLGCGRWTKRFCLFDRERLEVLLETGWEFIWIVPVQKWDIGRQKGLNRTGWIQFFHRFCHVGCHQRPPYVTVTL